MAVGVGGTVESVADVSQVVLAGTVVDYPIVAVAGMQLGALVVPRASVSVGTSAAFVPVVRPLADALAAVGAGGAQA